MLQFLRDVVTSGDPFTLSGLIAFIVGFVTLSFALALQLGFKSEWDRPKRYAGRHRPESIPAEKRVMYFRGYTKTDATLDSLMEPYAWPARRTRDIPAGVPLPRIRPARTLVSVGNIDQTQEIRIMGKHSDPKGGTGRPDGASPGKHALTKDIEVARDMQKEIDRAVAGGTPRNEAHIKILPEQR